MITENIKKIELIKSTNELRIRELNNIIKNGNRTVLTLDIISRLQEKREVLQSIVNGCNSLLQNPNINNMYIDGILHNYELSSLEIREYINSISRITR